MNATTTNGNGNGGNGRHGAAGLFTQPTPAGAARTMAQVLGEIVWLMSQSPLHKQMFIADLEWMVMTPALLGQFRLYYDTGDATHAAKPIGVVFWAEVDPEVAGRLAAGVSKLRPQDWKSGVSLPERQRQLWAVEVIAPFGGGEAMIAEFKAKVFPKREVRYLVTTANGKEVKVV